MLIRVNLVFLMMFFNLLLPLSQHGFPLPIASTYCPYDGFLAFDKGFEGIDTDRPFISVLASWRVIVGVD
jgi:hypothetical protein